MVNKVILVGRVGQDPETKSVGNTTVSKFSIATTEKYKDRNGEKVTNTEWHNIEVWGALSDIASQWVKKGQLLYIEGSIKTDQWEDNGVKRYATKIKGNNMTMLGGGEKNTQTATAPVYPTPAPSPAPEPISAQETDDLPF